MGRPRDGRDRPLTKRARPTETLRVHPEKAPQPSGPGQIRDDVAKRGKKPKVAFMPVTFSHVAICSALGVTGTWSADQLWVAIAEIASADACDMSPHQSVAFWARLRWPRGDIENSGG